MNAKKLVDNLLVEDVGQGVQALILHLTQMTNDYYTKNYPNITLPVFGTDVGPAYIRVWRKDQASKSVYCFVKKDDGTIWYAAGWKGPAKNFSRGNVNDPSSWAKYGPHGMLGR